MPNIASVLKEEISRIARREVKAEVAGLKKSTGAHRKEIASLKRRAHELEQVVRRLSRGRSKAQPESGEGTTESQRFSAKGMAAHRRRLGLSAAEVAVLLGTSAQTIYNWEQGKARPRANHLPAITALRTLGKRAAAEALAAHGAAD